MSTCQHSFSFLFFLFFSLFAFLDFFFFWLFVDGCERRGIVIFFQGEKETSRLSCLACCVLLFISRVFVHVVVYMDKLVCMYTHIHSVQYQCKLELMCLYLSIYYVCIYASTCVCMHARCMYVCTMHKRTYVYVHTYARCMYVCI